MKTHIVQVTLAVNYNKDAKELFALIDILKKLIIFLHKLQKNALWKRTDGNVVESKWKWNQTEKQAGGP